MGASTVAEAQAPPDGGPSRPEPVPLFASHDELPVTLVADIDALDRDRRSSPDRPGTVSVDGPEGERVEIPVDVRTRGEFRLDPSNCSFPPIRIDVHAGDAVGTVFEGQDDLKIVSSCRPGNARYDVLVPLEYLAYRMLNEVTDRSLLVRPVRLTLVDGATTRTEGPRFAFFIEDEDALAERFGAIAFDLDEGRALPSSAFDEISLVTTGVFEYMIGNTDWSDVEGHNVEILDRGGLAIAVPYDFDFSGLVDAPYAVPMADLGLDSVRERQYRGWCGSESVTHLVLERFRSVEPTVRGLFEADPRLDAETLARALRYLDSFFDDIATDDRAERRFLRDCRRD